MSKSCFAGGLTAILGASALVLGLTGATVRPAAAMPILSGSAVAPESAIVEARFRRTRSVRRASPRRPRQVRRIVRGRNAYPAAAIIGAFGAITAAVIAAERHNGPYYLDYGYAPVYGGYHAYPMPVYGYGYYPRHRVRRGWRPVYGGHRVRRAPVYRGYGAPSYRGVAVRPVRGFRAARGFRGRF